MQIKVMWNLIRSHMLLATENATAMIDYSLFYYGRFINLG